MVSDPPPYHVGDTIQGSPYGDENLEVLSAEDLITRSWYNAVETWFLLSLDNRLTLANGSQNLKQCRHCLKNTT